MINRLISSRWMLTFSSIALATGLLSCQPQTTAPPGEGEAINEAAPVRLTGAGASFPNPLYQRWFAEYNRLHPNIQISYQAVGSGAGVKQYLAKTVDFGATDAPLTPEERKQFRAKYGNDPIQIPMTGGAVVFAYNLGGEIENLKLSREAYCGIVTGKIKSWNDPQITSENPGVNLPNTPITFVHRSDGSGTTFIFTNHLDEACPNWNRGAGKSVAWLTGTGAKGNAGITSLVQQTPGAIGYVEYSYATENNLNVATLENRSSQYIEPSPDSAAAALQGQQIPADFALEVPDPTGAKAYPIVGLTWLLLYDDYDNLQEAAAIKNFVNWALTNGDQYAKELGYLPLTDEVAQRVQSVINQEIATR